MTCNISLIDQMNMIFDETTLDQVFSATRKCKIPFVQTYIKIFARKMQNTFRLNLCVIVRNAK